MISDTLIKSLFPNCRKPDEFAKHLSHVFSLREINGKFREAMFLAQVGHESQGLTRLVENLNYSAKALMATWPRRFPSMERALEFERKPEKIANEVYSNRLGNGPPETGDGWSYRGRGLIQVTGKSNYRACAMALGVDFSRLPEYLETIQGACESAGWFWTTIGGNFYADAGDVPGCTRKINGGLNGLNDRLAIYKKAFGLIGG